VPLPPRAMMDVREAPASRRSFSKETGERDKNVPCKQHKAFVFSKCNPKNGTCVSRFAAGVALGAPTWRFRSPDRGTARKIPNSVNKHPDGMLWKVVPFPNGSKRGLYRCLL